MLSKPLVSREEIAQKISEFAETLNSEYALQEVALVVILKGAIVFASDLIRYLSFPFTLDFVKCTSYVGTERVPLTITGLEDLSLVGKEVIVIDDICDSGSTIKAVTSQLKSLGAKSVKSLLLLKVRGGDFIPDYTLFEIAPGFVVGYGLDHNECHRGLPDIHLFETSP